MGMKCHYEVLGVPRDADDDMIKKSYRKLALRLHPDKNLDNIEQATLEFRVVQQAYDVLSDPQERAWYDKHREAILMGGMGRGDDYQDDSLDVYAYFNSSCYSGFHDDDGGFYEVYRKVFEQLAEEDYVFMDDKDSDYELPGFGDSLSDFNEVVGPFYGYWESYCTAKSYVWCEKWDTRDAPDRMTRRAMEQENRKLCEAKRKERNEEVRALVAFVKKRDKRVLAHKKFLEEKAKTAAKLAEEKRINDRREQLRKMEEYTETEWSASSNLEEQLQALENQLSQEFREPNDIESGSDEDDVYDGLFCIVCNKTFKSDRAMVNHEKSKKHKENVALLREEMIAEDEALALSESDEDIANTPTQSAKLSKKQKKKRKQQQQCESAETEPAESQELAEGVEEDICDRLQATTVTEENISELNDRLSDDKVESDDDFVHKSANKNKKKNKKKQQSAAVNVIITDKSKESPLTCKVCQSALPSRNKLFEHIKETGHAALKIPNGQSEVIENTREGKSKKKGKRK